MHHVREQELRAQIAVLKDEKTTSEMWRAYWLDAYRTEVDKAEEWRNATSATQTALDAVRAEADRYWARAERAELRGDRAVSDAGCWEERCRHAERTLSDLRDSIASMTLSKG